MHHRRRSLRRHRVLVVVIATGAMVACAVGDRGRKPDITLARQDVPAHAYVDPQPVGSYPSSEQRINGWINAGQTDSIRAHAWDIWQSMTAAVNDTTPTWQTWYTGHELFDSIAMPTSSARRGNVRLPLERPRQFNHSFLLTHGRRRLSAGIPVDTFERVFAFNRFSRSTANYIWNSSLNKVLTLFLANEVFNVVKAPIAQREVLVSADSVDALSFVTKVVFQFIPGDRVSAIPYWHGYGSNATRTDVSGDTLHPPPRYWKQGVAVDPTGTLHPGDSVFMAPNDSVPKAWLTVVPLSAFYHIKVTAADSANLTAFGSENGDDLGFNADTSQAAVVAAARPGNYGLMMAMHLTGKEIPNWTWQSFWWSPTPNDSLGTDRPSSIPSPWNNYVMTTTYSMLTTSGQPNIGFNPYLETSLAGVTETKVAWTGVISNCMSCHRRAAVGYAFDTIGDTIVAQVANYGPAANVLPGDSLIFNIPIPPVPGVHGTVKTDFLWSVALRAGVFQSVNISANGVRKAPPKSAATRAPAAARK